MTVSAAPREPPTRGPADLLGLVLRHAAERPLALALADDFSSYTYLELRERCGQFASGLSALGVSAGERVALHMGNSADFVIAALGCLWLGAAFVPLPVDSPASRLVGLVEDCRPALVVTGGEQGRVLGLAAEQIATSRGVLAAASGHVARSTDARRDAYLIYTSGTTGLPKGVRVPEGAFRWAVSQTVEALGLTPAERGLAVSAFHFDGSYGLVFPVLAAGGWLFVPRREDMLFLKRFYSLVVDKAITLTSFSPSYLHLVVSSRQFARLAGCQLRALLLGGEECIASDIEKLWSVVPEVKVFNRYGPTECAIAVTSYPVEPEDLRSGRVPLGTPHRGVEVFLIDAEDRVIVEDGPAGELYIGGEQLMSGYWGDDDLSRYVLREDIVPGRVLYRTGDLGYRDLRGRYIYLGRLDDVVKRNGVRISLEEVARAFRGRLGVRGTHCALVDNGGLPSLALFAEAEPQVAPTDLLGAARDKLPTTMLPDEVFIVGSFPLTPQHKVDRRRLLSDVGRIPWKANAAPRVLEG